MFFRVCHPYDFSTFLKYDPKTGKYDGPIGDIVTEGMEWLLKGIRQKVANVSAIVYSTNCGVGSYDEKSGLWTGCLGRLQQNLSDLNLQLVRYPIQGENITQGQLVYDTTITISGAYRRLDQDQKSQITRSFSSFSSSVWIACFVTLLTLALLYKARNKLRAKNGRNYYNFYFIACHCVRINQMPSRGLNRKIIFLSASIFSLIVVHTFYSLIKTELVVVKKPDVFNSYQDIITRKAIPIFLRGTVYDTFFRFRTAPEFRKDLWKKTLTNHDEKDLFIEFDPAAFLVQSLSLLNQKSVFIGEGPIAHVASSSGCALNAYDEKKIPETASLLGKPKFLGSLLDTFNLSPERKEELMKTARTNADIDYKSLSEFFFHTAVDPNEKTFAQSLVFSATFNEVAVAFAHYVRIGVETGLSNKIIDKVELLKLIDNHPLVRNILGTKIPSRQGIVRNCLSENVISSDSTFHPLEAANYATLIKICVLMVFIAYVVLLIERRGY